MPTTHGLISSLYSIHMNYVPRSSVKIHGNSNRKITFRLHQQLNMCFTLMMFFTDKHSQVGNCHRPLARYRSRVLAAR